MVCARPNPFNATGHYKCHQIKVKVEGLGRNSLYLAGFSIFFFYGSMNNFYQLAKKKKLLNLFSASPVFGQVQNFFLKIYWWLGFNAGEIYHETFSLEKTLNFFSYRSEKTGKSTHK